MESPKVASKKLAGIVLGSKRAPGPPQALIKVREFLEHPPLTRRILAGARLMWTHWGIKRDRDLTPQTVNKIIPHNEFLGRPTKEQNALSVYMRI